MKILAALFVVFALLMPASGQQITVAAAADLNSALKDLAAKFENNTGTKVRLSFGASGTLYSQIQNGAPFDLFFSADSEYPRKLADAGLLERGSLQTYALGHLVLWAPALGDERDRLRTGDEQIAKILARTDVKRIAIANPQHAPYGRAAIAVLKHLGIQEKMKDKLVVAENVGQAAQFVDSGNAQAGFVPLSLVISQKADGATYWSVPQEDYPEIMQVAGVVSASANKPAAQKFLDYVLSDAGAAILQGYGFSLPAKK